MQLMRGPTTSLTLTGRTPLNVNAHEGTSEHLPYPITVGGPSLLVAQPADFETLRTMLDRGCRHGKPRFELRCASSPRGSDEWIIKATSRHTIPHLVSPFGYSPDETV